MCMCEYVKNKKSGDRQIFTLTGRQYLHQNIVNRSLFKGLYGRKCVVKISIKVFSNISPMPKENIFSLDTKPV